MKHLQSALRTDNALAHLHNNMIGNNENYKRKEKSQRRDQKKEEKIGMKRQQHGIREE